MAETIELPDQFQAEDLAWCLSLATAPTIRKMGEWSEDQIILPNGPFSGERYRHHRHPVSQVYFDEIDSGQWSRVAATGPTQNGKTLMCYVIPTLYHLLEVGETTIVGLPTMDMAQDKWTEDFLPVIESSGYRDLLPVKGEGSRGGAVKRAIKFRNGATMRFMTAGGDDKKRAHYTSRVVSITETDGMDEATEASREADKIEQIEARTRAFGRTGKRVYLECTVSIERGRIWQEIKNGTDSKLLRPCVHCGAWVAPEREHLMGWQESESEEEAAEKSHFVCPSCDHPWTETDRTESAERIQICHRGQAVVDDEIVGDPPRTQTLGFRWSAIDNPFSTMGDLGAEEWLARKSRDPENAEKKMRQFVWSLPYDPPEIELTPLDPDAIEQRTTKLKKGIVPGNATAICVGVDTGKRQLRWTATSIDPAGGTRFIEYAYHQVHADRFGVKRALKMALTELAKYFEGGWQSESGSVVNPSQIWIDSGYHEHTDAVYEFCAESNARLGLKLGAELYRPTKGYGEGQRRMKPYKSPEALKAGVVFVGRQFHIARVKRKGRYVPGVLLVHMNADHWKSELHQRLAMPTEEPESLLLYEAAGFAEHTEFCQELCAERQIEQFIPGRGDVIIWERVDRKNHGLDSSYASICACEAVVKMIEESKVRGKKPTLAEMAKGAR